MELALAFVEKLRATLASAGMDMSATHYAKLAVFVYDHPEVIYDADAHGLLGASYSVLEWANQPGTVLPPAMALRAVSDPRFERAMQRIREIKLKRFNALKSKSK